MGRQMFLVEPPSQGGRALVFDYFAGGGGASCGIEQALGRSPDIAINHCANAIRMHKINHPKTEHLQVDVWDVKPRLHLPPGPVRLLWLSPDCTHFSRAKGGKPVSKRVRGLAWIGLRVAAHRRPDVICLENVGEFTTWGPVRRGRPIRARAGETFAKFIAQLRGLGYSVEWRTLDAADFGAPTHRRRLILIARRDGLPVVWPEPTHGPGRANAYRTAAECIDFSRPCPSIFDRKKPLADATLRRIAEGLRRFVIECDKPFIVPQGAPFLVQTGYGERKGQTPRALDIQAPLWTIVAGGNKHGLVCVFLAKHYGGMVGHLPTRPLGTITATDHHSVVEVKLSKEPPRPEVNAFLVTYYGQSVGQRVDVPLATIVSRARFGLATVQRDGETWEIQDIGFRMLDIDELKRCQGFEDSYQTIGTKAEQNARIGNSVCPQVARAVVAANVSSQPIAEAAE